MNVAPYEKGKPIYYEFTECPVAEFAKKYGLLEVMPALCNPDYTAMEKNEINYILIEYDYNIDINL